MTRPSTSRLRDARGVDASASLTAPHGPQAATVSSDTPSDSPAWPLRCRSERARRCTRNERSSMSSTGRSGASSGKSTHLVLSVIVGKSCKSGTKARQTYTSPSRAPFLKETRLRSPFCPAVFVELASQNTLAGIEQQLAAFSIFEFLRR